MSISLPIAELKPALIGLGKVISKKSTLPVLKHILVERAKAGWVTLSATDLESYVTVRLEQPSDGEPEAILVPDKLLADLVKTCGKDESISLVQDKNRIVVEYKVGNGVGKQQVEFLHVDEFPEIPQIKGEPIKIPDSLRVGILEAMDCASVDETRYVLNGAYIDISEPKCHQVVGTDGKHLYGSNSFNLPLVKSLIIPTRKFFFWKEFNNDGEWQLELGNDSDHLLFQISSRRWRIITRQVDGNYPHYRQVIPGEAQYKTEILIEKDTESEAASLIARIPCQDQEHHCIGIHVEDNNAYLRGNEGGSSEWTLHQFLVKARGKRVIVGLNRELLLKAIRFGMTKIQIIDAMSPIRVSGGGKQMIIMPIRIGASFDSEITTVEEPTDTPKAEAVNAETETPAQQTVEAPRAETQPTTKPMNEPTTTETASPVDQAIELVDSVRDQLQEGLSRLRNLHGQLKLLQKQEKTTSKEIQTFRNRLKDLQSIRI